MRLTYRPFLIFYTLTCVLVWLVFPPHISAAHAASSDLTLDRPLPAQAQSHVDRLVNKAIEQGSAYKAPWLALGHYNKTLLGYSADVKGDFFFRSEKGSKDSHAELAATLNDLFYPVEWMVDQNLHPQCHFPARLAWLVDELQITKEDLPTPSCALFNKWKADLDVTKVSVVFASYFMGHPASLFGHTFLRLHGPSDRRTMLDHGVEFGVALPSNMNPFQLAHMVGAGLLGKFNGSFSVVRYYQYTNKYNKKEARDLWSYGLNLTEPEIALLVNHLWEIGGGVQFGYSFTRNNCGFKMLELLDIVRPTAGLADQYGYFSDALGVVLTLETVRTLQQKNMLTEATFEPSVATVLTRQLDDLSKIERALTYRLIKDIKAVDSADYLTLSDAQRVAVLDATIEMLKLRAVSRRGEKEAIRKQANAVLNVRRELDLTSKPVVTSVSDYQAPLEGHPPARTDVVFNQTSEGPYAGMRFRLGVHELLDPSAGYPKNSHLQVPTVEAGILLDTNTVILKRLTLFHLLQMPPSGPGYKSTGFRLSADIHRDQVRTEDPSLVFDFRFAKGPRLNLADARLTAYLMPSSIFSLGSTYTHFGAVGLGAEAGLIVGIVERVRLFLTAESHYFFPMDQHFTAVKGQGRVQLTRRLSLGVEGQWVGPSTPLAWQVDLGWLH
jgi:hypothetical protein